jgi:hypothetical protein
MVLPRLQEPIVHRQIHINNGHIGHRRRPAAFPHDFSHSFGVRRPLAAE